MRRFAALWPELEMVQTPSAPIGWSHHQVLMDACGDDQGLYMSKMNLYLNAVDQQLRFGDDRESVGIILCTERTKPTTPDVGSEG